MRHKLLQTIDDFSMIEHGDRVIVALSGGADSVALLHLLYSVKEIYNVSVYACHLNHMIRGDEAMRDERFVSDLCQKLGVRLYTKRVDIPALSAKLRQSTELCGRNARYEFFEELSVELDAKVATAHTASDNTETVIYNISRGTSISGLSGIAPVRDYIIRPLIMFTRGDIERYCEDYKLSYVTDSTNLTDEYTRNNIRHNVVPVLKSINSGVDDTISRMSASMRDIAQFLDKIAFMELKKAKTNYGYDCEMLLSLDKAVLTHALGLIFKDHRISATYRHFELVILAMKNGGVVDLPDHKRAVCKQSVLRIVSCEESAPVTDIAFLSCDQVKYISKEELKNINTNLLINCIDCDIITDSTVVRTRKEGDKFTLCDRGITKSLKKLFNELKIPAEKRSSLLVVANSNTVLWIQGIGTSEQARVKDTTKGAYIITGGYYD